MERKIFRPGGITLGGVSTQTCVSIESLLNNYQSCRFTVSAWIPNFSQVLTFNDILDAFGMHLVLFGMMYFGVRFLAVPRNNV